MAAFPRARGCLFDCSRGLWWPISQPPTPLISATAEVEGCLWAQTIPPQADALYRSFFNLRALSQARRLLTQPASRVWNCGESVFAGATLRQWRRGVREWINAPDACRLHGQFWEALGTLLRRSQWNWMPFSHRSDGLYTLSLAFPLSSLCCLTPASRDYLSIKPPAVKFWLCLWGDPTWSNEKRGHNLSRRSRLLPPCGRRSPPAYPLHKTHTNTHHPMCVHTHSGIGVHTHRDIHRDTHTQTHTVTQTHTQTHIHTETDTHTDTHPEQAPVIVSGQVLCHYLRIKREIISPSKPCLWMLAFLHSLGLSSFLLDLSCSLQPSNLFECKTTSYNTEKMSRSYLSWITIQFQVPVTAYPYLEQLNYIYIHTYIHTYIYIYIYISLYVFAIVCPF